MDAIEAFGWVDAAMLGVLALSALVGAVRGFTFEVLSLAGWFAAWFGALWLGPMLAPMLPVGETGSALNRGVAFAGAFLGVLVLWGLAAKGVALLIGATPLRLLDRLLGAAFGLARGMIVLLALATLIAYTPAGRSDAWRASRGAAGLDAVLQLLLPWLAPEATPAPAERQV
ncbi:MAG: CvpA family protein [Caldimonas sp.]